MRNSRRGIGDNKLVFHGYPCATGATCDIEWRKGKHPKSYVRHQSEAPASGRDLITDHGLSCRRHSGDTSVGGARVS